MLMTVKEFVKAWEDGTHNDIDVYDDVCEELGIAFCGELKLKKAGREHFKEVLTYTMDVFEDNCVAVIYIDDEEGIWQEKLKKAKEFFYAAAGYCADDDWDKWFEYVE